MQQNRLFYKIGSFYKRIVRYFTHFPTRLMRLFRHIGQPFLFRLSKKDYWKDEADFSSWGSVIVLWIIELFVLILELLGFGELYETANDFLKYSSRPLTPEELILAQTVFGSTINYEPIRIDERAHVGPRFYRFCYVSFNIINSWGVMHPHILIHELVHIWQYQRFGAIYMIRALIAQHTHCGYDYGGIQALKDRRKKGEGLLDFNLEQQGDIITDYFLLKHGFETQWGKASLEDLPVYLSFVEELSGLDKEVVA